MNGPGEAELANFKHFHSQNFSNKEEEREKRNKEGGEEVDV